MAREELRGAWELGCHLWLKNQPPWGTVGRRQPLPQGMGGSGGFRVEEWDNRKLNLGLERRGLSS